MRHIRQLMKPVMLLMIIPVLASCEPVSTVEDAIEDAVRESAAMDAAIPGTPPSPLHGN